MKTTCLLALAAALFPLPLHAQKAADSLPIGGGLQLQIDPRSTPVPTFKGGSASAPTAGESKTGDEAPGLKKGKGPTQIDALDATFDQKGRLGGGVKMVIYNLEEKEEVPAAPEPPAP